MKVLQINCTCGKGSTGKIVIGIDDVLIKNEDKGYIAYGYYKCNRQNTLKLKKGNTKYSLILEHLKCRITGYYGFTSKYATNRLIMWIEEIEPDIIHLHNIHGGFVHIEMFFKYLAKRNIPIVWTLHDCWSFTGHCAHFDYIKCEKWKTGCHDCPQKNTYPKRWFFDRSEEQYKRKKQAFTSVKDITFVTPSKWLASLVKQSYFKDYPVYVINNGIDLGIFKPVNSNIKEEYGVKDRKLILAVASSWSQRKGYEHVIEISKRLPNEYKVCMIGLNERQMKNTPDNVLKIQRTYDQKELVEFYSAADVFINSTLEDNFPTVNLEAMACGTPVVTFDTGGSPESIDDRTGIVVKKEDSDGMVKAIKEINKERMFDDCLKRAQLFDNQTRYEDYLKLYKDIINRR